MKLCPRRPIRVPKDFGTRLHKDNTVKFIHKDKKYDWNDIHSIKVEKMQRHDIFYPTPADRLRFEKQKDPNYVVL